MTVAVGEVCGLTGLFEVSLSVRILVAFVAFVAFVTGLVVSI